MQTGLQGISPHGSGPPAPFRICDLVQLTAGLKCVTVKNGKLIDVLNDGDSGLVEGREL